IIISLRSVQEHWAHMASSTSSRWFDLTLNPVDVGYYFILLFWIQRKEEENN
ncbi:hypothetical protein ACJX0J_012477, partial [Zea mays]